MNEALDLFRRLPPSRLAENLRLLCEARPDLSDDVLGAVDAPLRVLNDAKSAREYLACEFNRDGDSYRSPWSGEYDPPLPDGTQPSDKLRTLEIAANEAFDVYREQCVGASSASLTRQVLRGRHVVGLPLGHRGRQLRGGRAAEEESVARTASC